MADNILKRLGDSNPHYARVKIKIGEKDIGSLPSEHILSFSMTRAVASSDSGHSLDFSLFDQTAIDVEYYLSQGYKNITFQFGYDGFPSDAGSDMWSHNYMCWVSSYSIDFSAAGAILSVQAVSGSYAAAQEGNEEQVTDLNEYDENGQPTNKYTRVSDYLVDLCAEMGWEADIVPSEVGEFGANGEFMTGNYTKATMDSFVYNEILPLMRSEDGQSGYHIWFETKVEGDTTITVLHAEPYSSGQIMYDFEFKYGNGAKGNSVLSFSPQFNSLAVLQQGFANMQASSVDPNTNEMNTAESSSDSHPEQFTMGGVVVDKNVIARRMVGCSSLSEYQLKAYLDNLWYNVSDAGYTASMEILGDPSIEPNKLLSILVTNKFGVPHHSSGTYWIKSVTDEISGGSYTTSLELVRRGNTNVEGNGTPVVENPASSSDNGDNSGGDSSGGNDDLPDNAGDLPEGVPGYRQDEGEWADDTMGSNGKTIDDDGCLVTSIATLMYMSGDESIDPGDVNQHIKNNNGYASGSSAIGDHTSINGLASTNFSYFSQESLSGTNADKMADIRGYMDQGYYCVADVGGHFVPIVGVTDGDLLMSDTCTSATGLFGKYGSSVRRVIVYKADNPFTY